MPEPGSLERHSPEHTVKQLDHIAEMMVRRADEPGLGDDIEVTSTPDEATISHSRERDDGKAGQVQVTLSHDQDGTIVGRETAGEAGTLIATDHSGSEPPLSVSMPLTSGQGTVVEPSLEQVRDLAAESTGQLRSAIAQSEVNAKEAEEDQSAA
jgi:hypothetical protein